jgi:tRNA-dihydrouridine synthase B
MTPRFSYHLAPMEGQTDAPFRTCCYREGSDVTYTEMARVSALAEGNKSTWHKIALEDGTPTVVQLLALKEEDLKRFLEGFSPKPGFLGFNLNVGCPSPDIIRLGMGCALVKRVAKVERLASVIKDRGFDVSVKLRLGLNAYEKERKTYLHLIQGVDASAFIVHARHGQEDYTAKADWSVFPACVATGKPIIANGDITTREDVQKLRAMGVAGVMVGRAAVKDPAIFRKLRSSE